MKFLRLMSGERFFIVSLQILLARVGCPSPSDVMLSKIFLQRFVDKDHGVSASTRLQEMMHLKGGSEASSFVFCFVCRRHVLFATDCANPHLPTGTAPFFLCSKGRRSWGCGSRGGAGIPADKMEQVGEQRAD